MPWCAGCDRFYNPNTLSTDGTCPDGHQVDDPGAAPEKLRKFSDEPAPWHFKVLLTATVIYLGFRALQGLGWVADHV